MFPSSTQLQGSPGQVQQPAPMPVATFPSPQQIQGGSSPTSYGAVPISATPSSGAGQAAAPVAAPVAAPAPPPDPYAAWGGRAAYDSLVSGYDTQKSNISNTAGDSATTSVNALHGSILDLLDSVRSGQGKINEAGVQNELAKKQGYNSILDMVSHGIQSGGVTLANKNASSSSAADAIARAYGDIGRRQNNKVNNQYELGNHNIGLQQEDLNLQKAQGVRHINESEQTSVDSIVADARNKLAALDAAIAGSNLPQRINIEQEKARIKEAVSGILGTYNNDLNSGVAAINPASADANRVSASGLATAGVSATNPFNFTTSAPAQFQNTGPFASELPIFTAPRKKTA